MVKPFVSIIIPTYKDWSRLSMCLGALSNQTYASDFFEVIVVNNNPQDKIPTGYIIPNNTVIIEESQQGSYAARNTALRIAKGEIIGFTDSDCIPDGNWIKHAVAFLEGNKKLSRIGGTVKVFTKNLKPLKVELYDLMFSFPQERYVNEATVAVTANMFTYKKVFKSIGNFDGSVLSGGDFDWGKRAQKAGFDIGFAEDVIVYHPARNSLKELIRKAARVGKGQVNYEQVNSSLQKIREIIFAVRPKPWEAKEIFVKGANWSLYEKIYLVILRHVILMVRDFSRIISNINK